MKKQKVVSLILTCLLLGAIEVRAETVSQLRVWQSSTSAGGWSDFKQDMETSGWFVDGYITSRNLGEYTCGIAKDSGYLKDVPDACKDPELFGNMMFMNNGLVDKKTGLIDDRVSEERFKTIGQSKAGWKLPINKVAAAKLNSMNAYLAYLSKQSTKGEVTIAGRGALRNGLETFPDEYGDAPLIRESIETLKQGLKALDNGRLSPAMQESIDRRVRLQTVVIGGDVSSLERLVKENKAEIARLKLDLKNGLKVAQTERANIVTNITALSGQYSETLKELEKLGLAKKENNKKIRAVEKEQSELKKQQQKLVEQALPWLYQTLHGASPVVAERYVKYHKLIHICLSLLAIILIAGLISWLLQKPLIRNLSEGALKNNKILEGHHRRLCTQGNDFHKFTEDVTGYSFPLKSVSAEMLEATPLGHEIPLQIKNNNSGEDFLLKVKRVTESEAEIYGIRLADSAEGDVEVFRCYLCEVAREIRHACMNGLLVGLPEEKEDPTQ